MRVVFCWTYLSGYMASCWRALLHKPGLESQVVALSARCAPGVPPFNDALLDGVPCRLLGPEEWQDEAFVARLVAESQPDVVVVGGWSHRPYKQLFFRPELRSSRFVLGMDTPWTGHVKQHLARFWLARLLNRVDLVVVSGERSWQYACHLGVPERKIRRGVYGVDFTSFSRAFEERLQQPGGWPRTFLYLGRLESRKGIEVLLDGYARYRRSMTDPWRLICSGNGPLTEQVVKSEGVDYVGFTQPSDLKKVWIDAGAFVIASHFDPWPLVVVEACAAGLPILCSEACGSAVELVRPSYNGLLLPTGDAEAVAEGMRWTHRHYGDMPVFGKRSRELASAYSAESWADRWAEWLLDLRSPSK